MDVFINNFHKTVWVEDQVRFWYGKYCWNTEKTWNLMGSTLQRSNVISINDTVEDLLKYPYFSKLNVNRINQCVLKIQKWYSIRPFTTDYVFPVFPGDNQGHASRAVLSHSRPIYDGDGMLCLWNNMYERFCLGGDDLISFYDKINKVHFRGSATGAALKTNIDKYKSNRLLIIEKWVDNHEWVDIGLINKPIEIKTSPLYETRIKRLIKDVIPLKDCMAHKYQLCIEGNDVSSSFSWALACNCVPLHPYPFRNVTWFMNGLIPFVHFIPLNIDASNLHEMYMWCENNQDKCAQIAANGKEHMKKFHDIELMSSVETAFINQWGLQIKHLKK